MSEQPTNAAPARSPTPEILLLGVLVAVGAALRFGSLGHSFFLDEAFTVKAVDRSFGAMLDAIGRQESTPPLYYVIAWGWRHLFGTGEWGLRSLSALIGTAAIPVTFAAARHLAGARAAVIAAGLVACNPLLVWYSQQARAYSLLVLIGGVTVLLFARAWENPSAGRLAAWSAACALAVLTHYFAVFLVIAEALTLWVLLSRQRRTVVLALSGIGVVALPLAALAVTQQSGLRAAWIGAIPLWDRVESVALEIASANVLMARLGVSARTGLAAVAVIALVWATIAVVLRRLDSRERATALVATAVGAVAILLPLTLALAGFDFFLDRNLIAAWVPLAIGLGVVLGARRAGAWGAATAVALCVAAVATTLQASAYASPERIDWRAISAALGRPASPRVIVMYPRYISAPLSVYGQRLSNCPRELRVAELWLVEAVHTATLPRPPGFHPVSADRIGPISISRFIARPPVRTRRRQLARGIRPPSSVPPGQRQLGTQRKADVACQEPVAPGDSERGG